MLFDWHHWKSNGIFVQFTSQVRERRTNFSSGSSGRLPFDYCYKLSPNQTEVLPPIVSLTTAGGAQFPVTNPIIFLRDDRITIGYCLAIVKNDITINIIGRKLRSPVISVCGVDCQ